MSEKLAYSIKEAAEALSVSVSTVKEEIAAGRIKTVGFGRRVIVPRWALEDRLRPAPAPSELDEILYPDKNK